VDPAPASTAPGSSNSRVLLPLPTRHRSLSELRDLAEHGARELDGAPAVDIVAWAVENFGPRLCVLSSMTDAVLAHLVSQASPGVAVLFGDTGYHFAETIGTRDAIAATLDVRVVDVRPDQTVAEQAATYGPDLFATNPDLCCRIRKTEPLRRALSGYDAWCSGIRRTETVNRTDARAVEWDRRRDKVKINPIVAWSDDQVDAYIETHGLLTNPLLQLGFTSIGCAPCTRAPVAGADSRSGRWSGTAKTECGLHI
jgi:phosphoadenosine phosphosulfate reductase